MQQVHNRGFTALELLVVMAIVAIVLAAGVPALQNYSWNLRMKTALDSLKTDLNFARGHAISHRSQTVICPAPSAESCANDPVWNNGWIVFTDLNGDRLKQADEPLLKRGDAIEFLQISSSSARRNVRFLTNGSAAGSNITIVFCDQRGAAFAGKIIVSNTGRIRVETSRSKQNGACS